MNIGLGNLSELKAQLLAAALRTQSNYDDLVSSIGLGVALTFDKVCNRKFQRVEGDICQFSSDRDHYYLPRYPVEVITNVEQRDSIAAGWLPLNEIVWNMNEKSGLIMFGGQLGYSFSQVQVTYTGGYWFDDSEDGTAVQPDGSTLLPGDLKLAWYLMARKVWEALDKTGASVLKSGVTGQSVAGTLTDLKMPPQVQAILDSYRRYQIT